MKTIHLLAVAGALVSGTFATAQMPESTIRLLPSTENAAPPPSTQTTPRPLQPVVTAVPPPNTQFVPQTGPNALPTAGALEPLPPTSTPPQAVIPAMAATTTQPGILPEGSPQTRPEAIPPGMQMPAAPCAFGLADLEGIALGNNPTLAQASARVQAARSDYVQVGLYPNPTVGYQGVEIGNEGRAGQQGVYLGQEFVLGKKRQLSRNAAAQAVRQAEQEFEAQRMRVVNDVRTGFYDTLVAQRRMEIVGQLTGIAEQGLTTTQKLFKPPAQDVPLSDVLQAEIELSNIRIVATNANNAYLSAWRRLAATLGVPNMAPVQLVGDLEAGIGELTWEQSLQQVLGRSPELAAARAGVEQARWALSRARAEPIPNVDVQLTMQHDNTSTSDITGVQAVLPFPLFNRNQGGIGRAQSELTVASREVERVQLELQQRLAAAYERYSNAKQQVDRYLKEILPKSKQALDLVAAGYRQGEFNYLMVLNAQRTYFQTNLAYLDALRELRETSIAIEGLLLTGSLGVSSAPPSNPPNYPSWDASRVVPGMGR